MNTLKNILFFLLVCIIDYASRYFIRSLQDREPPSILYSFASVALLYFMFCFILSSKKENQLRPIIKNRLSHKTRTFILSEIPIRPIIAILLNSFFIPQRMTKALFS